MLSFPAKAVPQSRKEALFYYEYYLLFISIDTMLLIIFPMDSLKTGKLSSATDRLVNSSRVTPADTKNLLISVYEYEGKLTMSII